MNAAVAETEPLTEAAERYTSDEVYDLVMEQAWGLSPFNAAPSELREQVYGLVRPVELQRLPLPSYGHRLFDSDQTQQRRGSYKLRGSTHAVFSLLKTDPTIRYVHIMSAGNAANGALEPCLAAGEALGEPVRLVAECTTGASDVKVGPLEADGAIVNRVHDRFEDGQVAARVQGKQPGHGVIEAYDAVETIAGQATIGWETLNDLMGQGARGEVDLHASPIKLFVPVGGGGLISGVACVIRWAKDNGLVGENVQVYGVQMEGCDAMARYRQYVVAGKRPPDDLFAEGLPFNPRADGTAVEEPGELTRAIACDLRFVADILTVSEGELGLAMVGATKSHGQRVEPAGALSLAGAWQYGAGHPARLRFGPPETLVTFTTGANVSDELYGYFMDRAAGVEREREEALRLYRERLWNLARTGLELSDRTGVIGRTGLRLAYSPVRSA